MRLLLAFFLWCPHKQGDVNLAELFDAGVEKLLHRMSGMAAENCDELASSVEQQPNRRNNSVNVN